MIIMVMIGLKGVNCTALGRIQQDDASVGATASSTSAPWG